MIYNYDGEIIVQQEDYLFESAEAKNKFSNGFCDDDLADIKKAGITKQGIIELITNRSFILSDPKIEIYIYNFGHVDNFD